MTGSCPVSKFILTDLHTPTLPPWNPLCCQENCSGLLSHFLLGMKDLKTCLDPDTSGDGCSTSHPTRGTPGMQPVVRRSLQGSGQAGVCRSGAPAPGQTVSPTSKTQLALRLPGTTSGAHTAKRSLLGWPRCLLTGLSRAACADITQNHRITEWLGSEGTL